jgi:hypothetical protein
MSTETTTPVTSHNEFPSHWDVTNNDGELEIRTDNTVTTVWEIRDRDVIDGFCFLVLVAQNQQTRHKSVHRQFSDAVTAAVKATERFD